jgi:biopolymer transport protein ExbB/TolQ
MSIHPIWLVLFGLVAIIPALIVSVIFLTKIESLRGDLYEKKVYLDGLVQMIRKEVEVLNLNTDTAKKSFEIASQCEVELINLKESFQALTNKWTSRERAEKREQARKEKVEREEFEESDGVPVEQQVIPFDQYYPQPQPQQSGRLPNKRKFGTIPG